MSEVLPGFGLILSVSLSPIFSLICYDLVFSSGCVALAKPQALHHIASARTSDTCCSSHVAGRLVKCSEPLKEARIRGVPRVMLQSGQPIATLWPVIPTPGTVRGLESVCSTIDAGNLSSLIVIFDAVLAWLFGLPSMAVGEEVWKEGI